MDYCGSIKELIINNELIKKAKYYFKNKSEVYTYYNVCKLLKESGKCYKDNIIKKYSIKLAYELEKSIMKETCEEREDYMNFSKSKNGYRFWTN